jgi:Flp pilus assembly protein TadD
MLVTVAILAMSTANASSAVIQVEETLEQVSQYLEEGDFKRAIKMISNAIAEHPGNAELLSTRASIYVILDKKKDAENDARAAFKADNLSCRANRAMAEFHLAKNNLDSALWFVSRATSDYPNELEKEIVLGLKGKIHIQREEFFEAETALLNASLCPEVSLNTMRDLASVLHLRGKDEEAVLILKETLSMFGQDLESYINTGYICNQIGFYDEAISYLKEALVLEKDNPIALSNLAYSQFKVGSSEDALKTVNNSLDNDNTNAFAYMVKGRILEKMGQSSRACKEYKNAVHMGYGVLYDNLEITRLIINACGTE